MRTAAAFLAAALMGSACASSHFHHRREAHARAHADFPKLQIRGDECSCSTYVTSGWVPMPTTVLVSPVPMGATTTTTVAKTSYICVTQPYTAPFPAPTPEATTCPTPGVYTIPAKTVIITSTATVCGATTVTPTCTGTTAIGGTVTVVTSSTVIVCPVPTIVTKEGTVTTEITSTSYVCPTPGTYTVGGTTKTVTDTKTIITCPAITTYAPGTYAHPESTVTVTKTSEVVVCPYSKVTVTAKSTVMVTPVPMPTYGSSPAPVGSGDHWAVVYTPYQPNGQCKTAEMVDSDLQVVKNKGFEAIRMYSTDCNGLANVGSSCEKYGLKMILGVWIKEGGVHTADDQVKEIIAWGKTKLVILFTIGNEAVFNQWCSAADLKAYIITVKAQMQAAGFNCPFTTAEPLITYQNSPDLADVIDVCGMNIHAYFNADVEASGAGAFVLEEIKAGEVICKTKKIYVCESGWPSAGDSNGKAVPGPAEQKAAIDSIRAATGSTVVFLSYEDDSWKAPGYKNVEQHWGCMNAF